MTSVKDLLFVLRVKMVNFVDKTFRDDVATHDGLIEVMNCLTDEKIVLLKTQINKTSDIDALVTYVESFCQGKVDLNKMDKVKREKLRSYLTTLVTIVVNL